MYLKSVIILRHILLSIVFIVGLPQCGAKQISSNTDPIATESKSAVSCSAQGLRELQQCIDSAKPGAVIELLPGHYKAKKPIIWSQSGKRNKPITLQGSGPKALGGDWGRSVLKVNKEWPKIENFSMVFNGHRNIIVQRLNISGISGKIAFKLKRTENISISDIYIEGGRKKTTEVFSTLGGAKQLSLNRIYATQIGKRFLRAQPLMNSSLTDIYADAMINGRPSNNWTFLYHFEDGSNNIKLDRTIGKNPSETGPKYDNGDCYATEKTSRNISFSKAWCFDPMDSGFDIKGKNHKIDHAIVVRSGNFAYRVWHGPVKITNSTSIFGGKGKYTCKSSHGHKTLWKKNKEIKVDGDKITAIKPGKKCYTSDKKIIEDASVRRFQEVNNIKLF